MRDMANPTTETLLVTVDRVKFTQENCSIFSAHEDDSLIAGYVTVKFFLGPVRQGQRWCVCGAWKVDEKFGRQFVGQFAALATPRTFDELAAFLTSGLVEGWGWSDLLKLQEVFGKDACTVIGEEPHRLQTEAGITDYQLESLMDTWERGQGLAPVYAQLTDWGIGAALADRLIKRYRFSVTDIIAENPYMPIQEVSYYTWRVAEQVRQYLGIADDDPRRIEAGVAEVIRTKAIEEGHTWMTYPAAIVGTEILLGLDGDRVEEILAAVEVAMDDAADSAILIRAGEHMYPGHLWMAEQRIAADLAERLQRRPLLDPDRVEELTKPDHLSDEQWAAVAMALTNPISLLTGGPGVGKTTAIKTVVEAAQQFRLPVTLVAPTGKAAQRMKEATGYPASTIHRQLKLTPGQSRVAPNTELLRGLVVADELSMLDTTTASALLSGISPDAHVLLVGDPDQLPSVGPGAVLRDLLSADVLSRIHLSKVFRNDAGIARAAASIRAGEKIHSAQDCQILHAARPEDAQQMVIDLLMRDLPAMGYTLDDVLVLCPTNEGPSGRHTLNTRLQALYNGALAGQGIVQKLSGKDEQIAYELRTGDRVIVTKNSTELGVFNGDVGVIRSVRQPKTIIADIDGREVTFSGADQKMLQLAYAITGHKSQGSEAPVVIAPIFGSRVLSREWLYTVLTRARKQVYLVGDPMAIQGCIRTVRLSERRTGLVAAVHDLVTRAVPTSRFDSPFAHADDSDVFHTRRANVAWKTSCGLDTRGDGWVTVPLEYVRPCMRCEACAGAVLRPFPAQVDALAAVV
ncbi:MAG: helicase, RecD/TraA family [Chloroflexi bacterium]|nr:helicase, RecD/TraA family [Chloroflexota bacterium]